MLKKSGCEVKEKPVCLRCNKQIRPSSGGTGWILNFGACQCEDPEFLKSDSDRQSGATSEEALAEADTPSCIDDRYEVISVLGKGGMGTVFKVKDTKLDRVFALKILQSDITRDSASLRRFQQEAESAAKLDHPNLVPVYGHGITQSEEAYLLMEYVPGETLAQRIERAGPMEENQAISILLQICSALSHAHEMKIIHRDIKPANVILSKGENGEEIARVVDFGIAKTLPGVDRETRDLTQTGEVFGSPHYMSPEQCLGFMLDQRSDIYSFGCLMYEILSGKPPFAGNNPIQLVVKHINEAAKPFNTTLGKQPKVRGLQLIALKCLEKQQIDRFQGIDEISELLMSLSEGRKLELTDSRVKLSTITTKLSVIGFLVPMITILTALIFFAYRAGVVPEQNSTHLAILTIMTGTAFMAWLYYELGRLCLRTARNRESPKKHWWLTLSSFSSALVFASFALPMVTWVFRPSGIFGVGHVPAFFHYWELVSFLAYIVVGFSSVFSVVCAFGYILDNDTKKVKMPVIFRRAALISAAALVALFVGLPREAGSVAAWLGDDLSSYPEELSCGISPACAQFATRLDRTDANTVKLCASTNLWTRRYDEAIKDYSTLINLTPESKKEDLATYYGRRGDAYREKGDYQSSIDDYSKEIAIEPLQGYAYADRGEGLIGLRKFDLAVIDFSKALELVQRRVWTYYQRAKAYFRNGQYEKAIEDYNQLLKIDEKRPSAFLCRSFAYEKLGDSGKAEQDLRLALQVEKPIKDHDFTYHFAKGLAHLKLGQLSEAKQDFLRTRDAKSYEIRSVRKHLALYPEEVKDLVQEYFPGL